MYFLLVISYGIYRYRKDRCRHTHTHTPTRVYIYTLWFLFLWRTLIQKPLAIVTLSNLSNFCIVKSCLKANFGGQSVLY